MVRKALIRTTDGFVVNVIEIDDASVWPVPNGHRLQASLVAGPGDTWNGTRFVPSAPPPPPRINVLRDKIAADTATIAELREFLKLAGL